MASTTTPNTPEKQINSDEEAPRVQMWETPEGWKPKSSIPPAGAEVPAARSSFLPRLQASYIAFLDRHVPSRRRYLGMRRRTFLWVLLAAFLALLALIIGLAVGLTTGRLSLFLPLPSDRQAFTGDLTYYGPGLGACGEVSTEDDMIVSMSHFLYDHEQTGSDPNQNPLCGRMIRAQRFFEDAGEMRSVDLRVVDRCTGCQPTDIDVSPGAFRRLANMDLGRVGVTWAWL